MDLSVSAWLRAGDRGYPGAGRSAAPDAWLQPATSITGTESDDTLEGTTAAETLEGLGGNDLLIGGARDDTLLGGAGDDTLNGGLGADQMLGGEGNDRYSVDAIGDTIEEGSEPGSGIDSVFASIAFTLGPNLEHLNFTGGADLAGGGNTLANRLTGNAGANALDGGAGDDTLAGLAGGDTLTGGIGRDSLNGGDGADSLSGGSGPDTLAGGAGLDTLVGGTGNDRYVPDAPEDAIQEEADAGNDVVVAAFSVVLGAGIERLQLTGGAPLDGTGNGLDNRLSGNAVANRLLGDDGNDTLSGRDGPDTLDGGAGADLLQGGDGDDGYFTDDSQDAVVELDAEGTDGIRTTLATAMLPEFVEQLVYIGIGSFAGTGNGAANTLSGGSGNDTLDGGAGGDSMLGGLGSDRYLVDDAADVVTETDTLAGAVDTVVSGVGFTLGVNLENLQLTDAGGASNGAGNSLGNALTGGALANTLTGLEGNDSLLGEAGDDSLVGGTGSDTLVGGSGTDTMVGGTGNDLYVVDSGSDVLTETDTLAGAVDTVQASVFWTLGSNVEHLTLTGAGALEGTGNSLANQLTGNAAANLLSGVAGNDTLQGDAGNDTLSGGPGADSLTGGSGLDRFVIDAFVLDTTTVFDTLSDFVTGSDQLAFDMSVLGIGDGDTTRDGALTRASGGGWSAANELVVFTANLASLSAAATVAAVGAASVAVPVDTRLLFVVDNGTSTAVWMFESDDFNSTVATSELTLLATLSGTPATTTSDYLFVA